MSVRRRLRCRMISSPAAKGMSASSARPMATDAPSKTNRSIASGKLTSFDLFGSKLRHFLVDVGVEAFLRILALEEQLLQLAFDGERFGERHLGAGLHGALDVAYGLRCFVRRGELLGVGHDVAHELFAVAVVDL